ncbi:MAG TPA: FAD-dependent oxidoreductase, partial [Candidatus Sulfotelmatobacter sp.]|nr:FAD-dependent oxidoreductase [Candidatus Sulfotelmatobacter sp.]
VDLFPYARRIYLLHRRDVLKGDPVTQEKVKSHPKVTVILNAETQAVLGRDFVEGLKYKDGPSGETKQLEVQGVFVEVGSMPNSDLVKGLVQLNEWGSIVVDHKSQRASVAGIWAAGDVADGLYKQNNISVGDAVKAVLNIYDFLNKS